MSSRAQNAVLIVATLIVLGYFIAVIAPKTSYNVVEGHDKSEESFSVLPLTPSPYVPEPPGEGDETPTSSPRTLLKGDVTRILEPWGYNAPRNTARWKAIRQELLTDNPNPSTAHFTLVDYGADQGYFTVSTASLFPSAMVIAIEMGGVGGEIWAKGAAARKDVLRVMEEKINLHGDNHNVVICKTKAQTQHWTQMNDNALRHTYQYVLSVFHWFDLPTRELFEIAISQLFRNARTTFIELPTAGDGSALIKKQVGSKNFLTWYEGRNDLGEVMKSAAENQKLSVIVRRVASLPWLKWTRDVYRVDVNETSEEEGRKVNCPLHLKIYDCEPGREKYAACPMKWLHA